MDILFQPKRMEKSWLCRWASSKKRPYSL